MKKTRFKCEQCNVAVSRNPKLVVQESRRKYCSEKCLMKWRLANG